MATAGKRSTQLKIAGQVITRGETRKIDLPFSETYLGTSVSIPVYVMRSKKEGPRVFLTATIHGDELNGLGVLRELLYDKVPALKMGTLIVIPVVNFYGMENHTRYLPDRRDLNRCFPGSASGSLSSRLAHVLFHEIIRKCDYGIDFHTGAIRRTNFPNIRANMKNPATRMLAKAFGCELIVHGQGAHGTLRHTATQAGVPTIILEAGEVWKIEPMVVEIGNRGIINVLKHLGMVSGEPTPSLFQVTSSKTVWVRAEAGGILDFRAKPGDLVAKNQVLAINANIFGEENRKLISPVHGIVLGISTMPAIKPGEPVYHIAQLSARAVSQVRKLLASADASHAYNRMQSDLATNIFTHE
ncbi:MAG: succinylglutamate desuccinylase/aspartoacylase family protein [Candidatus Hydrogenedentes bacterium]|nr:succinylglutamate desuccinylase/aspartoacylase family protein [Candidatus Hydrogenedentota bacterium]